MKHSEMRKFYTKLKRLGFSIIYNKHMKIYDGKRFLVASASSPEDPRAIKNIIRDLKHMIPGDNRLTNL